MCGFLTVIDTICHLSQLKQIIDCYRNGPTLLVSFINVSQFASSILSNFLICSAGKFFFPFLLGRILCVAQCHRHTKTLLLYHLYNKHFSEKNSMNPMTAKENTQNESSGCKTMTTMLHRFTKETLQLFNWHRISRVPASLAARPPLAHQAGPRRSRLERSRQSICTDAKGKDSVNEST